MPGTPQKLAGLMDSKPTPFQLRARDVQLYHACDALTGPLIFAMSVFSPWAFGTTQRWSVWVMTIGGYLLGVLWLAKCAVRRVKGYRAPRWGEAESSRATIISLRPLIWALGVLTVAIVAYCFISPLNAYATYDRAALSFDYRSCLRWLPHSFDSNSTWPLCWSYLALACSFWSVRDWILGKTEAEARASAFDKNGTASTEGELFPARLRGLLWLLAINGGLLALEGIAQRIEGSGKLLFLVKPRVNQDAITQFGPYAYRANAAQYFNLLWPVCVGFWWMLQRSRGFKRHSHHVILACAVLMAACPIISTSRGGAIITVGILFVGTVFLIATHFLFSRNRNESSRARTITATLIVLFCLAALIAGYSLGWKSLKPRLDQIEEGFEGREQTYAIARPMARDYPIFGTGPGTFETVFQLYRKSTDTYWPAQLHNDWLETRITFGWVGSALIAGAFLCVSLRWFTPGGLYGGRRFVVLLWLALGGCIVHARYDFPFQIYSIVFLFLIWCAVLSNLSRRT